LITLQKIKRMETNAVPTKETLKNWHKDPANWKWGMFYYNKNDKRIFPLKRIAAFAWTVNFANPYSILVMIAMIVFILGVIIIINRWN
jgi:uncharacterized membrane protein